MKIDKSSYLTYLEFLDDVLNSIHHKINSVENLQFPDNRDISGNLTTDGERTNIALPFLLKEEYIKKDNPYSITYKGILLLANGGFVQEFKDKEEERKFIRSVNKSIKSANENTTFTNNVSIVISIIAIITSIITALYLSCKN